MFMTFFYFCLYIGFISWVRGNKLDPFHHHYPRGVYEGRYIDPFHESEDLGNLIFPLGAKTASHSKRLTDVVMVMIPHQIEDAIKRMSSWAKYPPCDPLPKGAPGLQLSAFLKDNRHPDGPLGQNVRLTWLISNKEADGCPKCKDRLQKAFDILPLNVRKCFSSTYYRYLQLHPNEDNYFSGSRAMFEYVLRNSMGVPNPQYVFQMETDVYPIRPNWLAALDAITRTPNEAFWIKGSIPRKNVSNIMPVKHIPSRVHINGNAIYNVGDSYFVKWYFINMSNYIQEKYRGKGSPYDQDLGDYFADSVNWKELKHILSLFQYTDVIQNLFHEQTKGSTIKSSSDTTFLVHGSNFSPELK